MWAPLASEAGQLSLQELVIRLVDSTVVFVERHPAFLTLLDAPASTHLARRCARKLPAPCSQLPARSKTSHVAGKGAASGHRHAADGQSDEFFIP